MSPEVDEHILASSTILNNTFVAAIEKGNIMGVQFHPEKSGDMGLAVLDRLIRRKLTGENE
jgi:imidazoleglycerol phosphate synthase glutamine amidotransferase subunit HisH